MSILRYLALDKIIPKDIGLPDPITNGNNALAGILTTVYFWAGIVCVIVIVGAGYLYVTSNGNSTQTKRAKDAILGAVVGLVVVIMAFVITQFVIGRF